LNSAINLNGANILVTGGSGSFGKAFIRRVLENWLPERLIVFSRDEFKQFHLRNEWPEARFPNLQMVLGDVRDPRSVDRVMAGMDIVVHAAALKQIFAAEVNPLEVIKTNILGAANIIDAAVDHRVKKVIALSTDKAANPINLYGATKLCSDKLFVAANATGSQKPGFSVVRYGNVAGSRGSVIPFFLDQRPTGRLTITDRRMTRFLITLNQGVDFVLRRLDSMIGGELFVPKIPSVLITELARVIAPECEQQITGIRPGEKLHETMIPEDDARLTIEFEDHYVIQPAHSFWDSGDFLKKHGGQPCPDGYHYSSDNNDWWLKEEELGTLVGEVEVENIQHQLPAEGRPRFVAGG
jgi:UDP-N-acetylglucosamine 4,6-dehydratase